MKITLNDVTNIDSLATINSNFDKIEQELQNKVLYRDNPVGEPNTVNNNIDMNGNNLLNVGNVYTSEGRWATIDEVEAIQDDVTLKASQVAANTTLTLGYKNSAEAANNSALAALDNFEDRYLGNKTSDPSVDNDGNTLLTGALYFRTSGTPIMRVYNGTTWQDVGSITTTTTNLIDPSLYSSQAEAEAGVNNTKVMTPLRVKNAIDKQVKEGFTSTGDIVLPGNTSNALGAVPKQQAESIAAAAVAGKSQVSLLPYQTTNGATFYDFTSIPSWAKKITINFSGVSTNGTSAVMIQIGAGSISSTGYGGSSGYTGSSSTAGLMSNGFTTETASGPGVVRHGHSTLTHLGDNYWVFSSVHGRSESQYMHVGGGSKLLSGTLDRIRITTAGGVDTFDVGFVSVLVEG